MTLAVLGQDAEADDTAARLGEDTAMPSVLVTGQRASLMSAQAIKRERLDIDRATVVLEGNKLTRTVRAAYLGVETRPQSAWINDRQLSLTAAIRF